jgi:hypothetical protein
MILSPTFRTTTFVDTADGTAEVKTPLNNFADDTVMVVSSETEVRKLARAFTEHIESFQVKLHKKTSRCSAPNASKIAETVVNPNWAHTASE